MDQQETPTVPPPTWHVRTDPQAAPGDPLGALAGLLLALALADLAARRQGPPGAPAADGG